MPAIVLAACLLLSVRSAGADAIDDGVRDLNAARTSKVRIASVLALSKSKDPRAILAVSGKLNRDPDPTVRRICALALQKMLDERTAPDALQLALGALDRAATTDRDEKVKGTAAAALRVLSSLRGGAGLKPSAPSVFVNIDPATDQSKLAPKDAGDRLIKIVRRGIETRTGYATSWPGGLPTSKELTTNKSQAYIVASTVKKIEVTKGGAQTTIACTVAIRVAPWSGKDGGEKWEANKAASASGSAKATTGNSDRAISTGMRDCLEAVTEDVTTRQVVPFIKRLAQAGS